MRARLIRALDSFRQGKLRMNASNVRSGKAHRNHADILAVLHFTFGVFHAFALFLMLLFSGGALLSSGGRAWENDLVSEGIIGSLIAFPFVVAFPLLAAYCLSNKRAWAKVFVALSATVALLLSTFVAYAGFIDRGDLGVVIYVAPCLATGVYSFWFVYRKVAV